MGTSMSAELVIVGLAVVVGAGSLAWMTVLLKRAAYDCFCAALDGAAIDIDEMA